MSNTLKFVAGAFALSVVFALPSQAATIVLGTNLGHDCYKAVDGGQSNSRVDRLCTQALGDEMLGKRDIAATYVNRGIVRLRLDRPEEALADFATAIAMVPDFADAYTNRAAAEVALGHTDAALASLNTAIELKPEKLAVAYLGRAMVLESMDRLTEAYHDYKRAAALAPDWDAPRVELSRYTVVTR